MSGTYRNLLIIPLLFLFGCSKNERFTPGEQALKQYPILFNNVQSPFIDQNITCDFQLRAKKSGDTLLFVGAVDNESADTLKLNPDDLQIEACKGNRTDVEWCDAKKLIIPPNSIDTVQFKFAPINNLNLHERINYNGDMDSIYYVTLNFIHRNNTQSLFGQRMHFTLNSKDYTDYKGHFGLEKKLELFQLKTTPGVQIQQNDILINGAVIRLNYYSVDSTLFLRAAIINHSREVLIIKPFEFKIGSDGKTISPKTLTINNTIALKSKNIYALRGGERLEFRLKYDSISVHQFAGLIKGILYNSDGNLVFPQQLQYQDKPF